MRELTVRIRFTKHSLGNVKKKEIAGKFLLPRNTSGAVTFLASWHYANMKLAAQLLGRHQDEVSKILWDIAVDAVVRGDSWFRRYYTNDTGRQRYVLHESFVPDQIIGINCVVPSVITDEDFWRLMQIAGQYKGLSPARPGEFGHFEVVSIRPRRVQADVAEMKTGVMQNASTELPVQ